MHYYVNALWYAWCVIQEDTEADLDHREVIEVIPDLHIEEDHRLLDADLGTLPLQYFWTAVTFPSPNLNYVVIKVVWVTGIRGLMRGMATLPKVTRTY